MIAKSFLQLRNTNAAELTLKHRVRRLRVFFALQARYRNANTKSRAGVSAKTDTADLRASG